MFSASCLLVYQRVLCTFSPYLAWTKIPKVSWFESQFKHMEPDLDITGTSQSKYDSKLSLQGGYISPHYTRFLCQCGFLFFYTSYNNHIRNGASHPSFHPGPWIFGNSKLPTSFSKKSTPHHSQLVVNENPAFSGLFHRKPVQKCLAATKTTNLCAGLFGDGEFT